MKITALLISFNLFFFSLQTSAARVVETEKGEKCGVVAVEPRQSGDVLVLTSKEGENWIFVMDGAGSNDLIFNTAGSIGDEFQTCVNVNYAVVNGQNLILKTNHIAVLEK